MRPRSSACVGSRNRLGSESAGHSARLAAAALLAVAEALEHGGLVARHPADDLRVGEVVGLHRHVDLAGDAGLALERVEVAQGGRVLRNELLDVGDDLRLRVGDEPQESDRHGDPQHPGGALHGGAHGRAPGRGDPARDGLPDTRGAPVARTRSRAPRTAVARISPAARTAPGTRRRRPGAERGGGTSVSAANPAVSAHPKASAIPITSSSPKPRTIGTGDSRRTRKPAPVARQAVAMVGPSERGRARSRLARGQALGAHHLVVARMELDRVVDGEPDQDGKHGDRGHGQGGADDRHGPEQDAHRRQGDGERQQPRRAARRRAEGGQQGQGHHDERRDEQDLDGAGDVAGERGQDDRSPADHVDALAVGQAEVGKARGRLDEPDRAVALGIGQVGAQAHLDESAARAREQIGEARLRHAHPARRVEHELRDEVGIVDSRQRADAVVEREAQRVAEVLGAHELARLAGQPLLDGLAAPLGGRELARGRHGARLALRLGLLLAGELLLDLADRLVDERARAVHDLHGLVLGQLRAGPVRAPRKLGHLARHVARDAALQAEQASEIRGEHELRQVLAYQHDHGVVAEALVEVLGGLEGRRVAAHQRVGRRARPQPERQHAPAHGEQPDQRDHQPGPAHGGADDALQSLRHRRSG